MMQPSVPSSLSTDAIGASAMNKAFWRILPLIGLAYLFAYMDRVNVSFAAAAMNEDLKFSATVYGLGGGLFFLAYALFEIPSNLMLVRFGARKWIARIMITWGLLSAAMMFVQTPMHFYVLRFLLGVAEAGFYPGVIFYFASWFPPCHRSRAVSRFFVFSPLASVVMGAMSGWLLGLDGNAGLHGWQWLFLVQGLPTVFVGLIVLRYLPDSPRTVAWLSQPEKDWIERELAAEQARLGAPAGHNVLAAFRNQHHVTDRRVHRALWLGRRKGRNRQLSARADHPVTCCRRDDGTDPSAAPPGARARDAPCHGRWLTLLFVCVPASLNHERRKTGETEMKMIKSLAIAAMLGATALAAPAMAQESSYKSGSVWTAGRIHVLPGQFENYMDWLAADWKRMREFGKKEGVELSYHVLQVNNPRKDEPNLILLIEYKDYLTNAQQDAFSKKLNAFLATDDRKAGAAGAARGAMREQWGSTEYQELILK